MKAASAASLIALLAVAPHLAGAADLTLAQQRGWAEYHEGIVNTAKRAGAACATTFNASYDQASYPNFDPMTDLTRAACQHGIDGLAAACRDDAGKQAAQSIKTLTCRYSTTDTGVERQGDQLIFRINPDKRGETVLKSGEVSTWANAVLELL